VQFQCTRVVADARFTRYAKSRPGLDRPSHRIDSDVGESPARIIPQLSSPPPIAERQRGCKEMKRSVNLRRKPKRTTASDIIHTPNKLGVSDADIKDAFTEVKKKKKKEKKCSCWLDSNNGDVAELHLPPCPLA
jgi:hypothetical protein